MEKLQSPDTTTDELGAIIARDPVATAKILQLVNSAFFGLGHNITSPGEAVSYLGIERVRALMLLVHTCSNYEQQEGAPVKAEALARHSLMTGNLARLISREESRDAQTAEKSFTGGILHDLGKLMLAVNQPADYTTALHLAQTQNRPIQDAETEVFGGSHTEIGACVLGIWGLPPEIVEAIAFHHAPNKHFWDAFGPVTAVHAADCLLHEFKPDTGGAAPPAFDHDYLARLGLQDRVDTWRDLCREALAQVDNG
jgi:putative nucleotidyltransferase with HDIG domain